MEILLRRALAAIRHVGDVHPHLEVEQHARQVGAGADSGRAELHLALIGFDIGDELLEVRNRQVLAHDQDARRFGREPHRGEVGQRVIERLFVHRLAVGLGTAIADQEHVAVRRSVGDSRRAGHAGRPADILDHERLAEQLAHFLRLDAGADIDAAAGGKRHDERDRPSRPILGADLTAQCHERRDSGGDQSPKVHEHSLAENGASSHDECGVIVAS